MNSTPEFKKHVLLYPSEQLLESLQQLQPPFKRLIEVLHPVGNEQIDQFMGSTYVQRTSNEQCLLNEHTLRDIIDTNIGTLLSSKGRQKFVQAIGYERKNGHMSAKSLNFNRAVLENSLFGKLLDYFSAAQVAELITNYTIVLKYEEQYVQVTGPSLPERLNEKLDKKREYYFRRYDDAKNDAPKYQPDFYLKKIERSRMMFCNYMGRQAGIHRKNLFKIKPNVWKYDKFQTETTVATMMEKTVGSNGNLYRHNERVSLRDLYIALLVRMRQTFCFFKKQEKSAWSKFSSLLSNTCALPKNYRTLSLLAHSYHKNTAEQNAWTFNQLYDNYSRYSQVSSLLVDTMKLIMPPDLLGPANNQLFYESIVEFVQMKRFENVKLDDMVYKMDMFKVPWLCPHYNHKYHKQIMSRRRKAVALVVLFLFNQILVPIVQYNFYVTDYHKEGNKIFYFSKPIWTLIAHLAITAFSQNNLQPVGINDNALIKYPQGKLRIMPKKDSFRPIITFNRKAGVDKDRINLNQLLQDTQLVLRNLKEIVGVRFGFGVFDNRHISRKYDAFVEKWRNEGRPELAFFTLDIKKCYDSICPKRLLEIIKDTPLIEELYIILKYQRMYRNKRPLGSQRSLQHTFNLRERECAVSLRNDLIKIIEESTPPAIHVYLPRQRIISRKDIIQKLSHICQQSYISFGRKRWRQTFGIPQGLNVSSVLCSLYFAYLQAQYVTISEGVLMRLTDDYLYIGPKREAQVVLRQLFTCAEQNSFEFNQNKVKGNFKSRFIRDVSTSREFNWIGKTIRLDTLEMFPSVDRKGKRLEFAANVNIPRRSSYKYLKNKIKGLTTNHFYSYFKPQLFCLDSLYQTITIVCGIALEKFWPFILKYAEDPTIQDKAKVVYKILSITLHEFVLYACYLYREKELITNDLYYKLLKPAVQQYEQFLVRKRSCKWVVKSTDRKKEYAMFDVSYIHCRFMRRRKKLEKLLDKLDH